MSIARHHAEWLSLIEASGPFLSLQTLLEVFPQGLDAHDPERFRVLRQAYEEWLENHSDVGIHRTWGEWVLKEILEFPDEVLKTGQNIPQGLKVFIPEHQETLRPDYIVNSIDDSADSNRPKIRLLVQIYPPEQGLEKTLKNSRWSASPATRMMELLRGTGVWLGLITNGEHWMLINAPTGTDEIAPGIKYNTPSPTVSYISWYANLWLEEKITLQAFRSLLGVQRFFGVPDDQTLEALFVKSADSQQEVTDQLGYQVRKAVEVLIQKIDKIDQDRNRSLLKNISQTQLYEAALFMMMRLVFLFSAEEKGLLRLGESLYDQSYSVSTLRSQLREIADHYGEEILERRHDAWCRLLATFRAVYGGIDHDLLRLPALGGDLFNPDKFPFLEGRTEGNWQQVSSQPILIDNRTVLHLLEALQILQIKVPGGGTEPRRLSFRALDVEQIGHVYEGLLDHTAIRATSPVLGLLGTKDKEPEITLDELEIAFAKGENEFIKILKTLTGRSETTLKKAVDSANFNKTVILSETKDLSGVVKDSRDSSQAQNDKRGYPQNDRKGVIYRAVNSRKWEGTANLEVAFVWMRQGEWQGDFILDEKPVNGITPFLTVPGKLAGNPYRLMANQNKSFIGSYVLGMGFVLEPEEAQKLIEKNPKNKDVLFPYLNGEDLNSSSDQSPSRWVINFKDWPLDADHDDLKKPKGKPYAVDYPDCLKIIEEKVKPERDKNNRKERREKWWQYAEKCPALYEAIADMERVLVAAITSKFLSFTFLSTGIVYSIMTVVFTLNDYCFFAILNTSWHTDWIVKYCSSLETRLRYIPTDGFETFPFPIFKNQPSTVNILEEIGENYYNYRQQIMLTRQQGLTKTYNRFHNPDEQSPDIIKLRQLHIEMDQAVALAYGWDDLALDHNFHETKQGIRYTISEAARREVLDRLLQLNHQRYEEEVEAGLHDKGKKKAIKKKPNESSSPPEAGQLTLF